MSNTPSYDDLQRFKDKMQTDNLSFKEINAPKTGATNSDWNVIHQLIADTDGSSPFPHSSNASRPAPEAVSADAFLVGHSPLTEAPLPLVTDNLSRREDVPSLLQSIAPVATTSPAPAPVAPAPLAPASPATGILGASASSPAVSAPAAPPYTPPVAPAYGTPIPARPAIPEPATVSSPPPEMADTVNFAALFAPSPVREDSRTATRALLLDVVLERIASCR